MSEIIICIGLMGVGKTTFAKKYAKDNNYEYICFDELYHAVCKNDISLFASKLKEKIKKDKNYILDNWFKWNIDWYLDENVDNSIDYFNREVFREHNVKLFFMHTNINKIKEQYHDKSDRDLSMSEDKYHKNMKIRFHRLITRFKEAFKWEK